MLGINVGGEVGLVEVGVGVGIFVLGLVSLEFVFVLVGSNVGLFVAEGM